MKKIFEDANVVKGSLPSNKTFTLVGGVFDLIHVGHVHLLEYASTLEDLLVVAVLSDKAVRKYKDTMRPVINQRQRALMVASIRFADFVYISEDGPSSIETLELLKPDSVVFGEEASNAENVKRWAARIKNCSPNTKIRLLPRYSEEEISTSHIINRIQGTVA